MNAEKRLAISYFISEYPALSHTFVSREISGLRRLGVDIKVFSVHKPPIEEMSGKDREAMRETEYIFPLHIPGFIWAHLYYLIKKPKTYLGTLFFLLSRKKTGLKNRFRTFYHFCEGVWLAKKTEGEKHIHVHFIEGTATAAMAASRLTGISFSVTAHGSELLIEQLLLKEKAEAAKFIITISNYNKNFIAAKVPASGDKTHVVHSGVDPFAFLPSPRQANVFTILCIGRLVPVKGYPFLLEACKALKDKRRAFRCIIIGEGPERAAMQELIAEYGLDNNIELKGLVYQEQIQEYYDVADIFVLSSVSEGIPVVLMEAMSKEIPVVATRITGIPELVEDRNSGLLVSPGNATELGEAMSLLMENGELRKKIGKKGRETVLRDFNLEKNIMKLKSIFSESIV
ncbi:MAG: glycosyltransferase family 4 protein [Gammaproteobacteria bacterium]|nr:glycosyltransferase family 4 protein [Gammaproteobacteria bacterium]